MTPPNKKTAGVKPKANAPRRKRKKVNPASRSFWVVMLALAFIAVFFQYMTGNFRNPFAPETGGAIPLPDAGEIRVYFLDVAQGDSILLQTDEHAVLIDAGEYSTRGALLSYLRDAGVSALDYLIATHPHEDHIGGMVPVLENFTVKNVAMADAPANTDVYERFLSKTEELDIPVTFPRAGDVITAGLISLNVLAPLADYSDDLNNASLVLRMLYGETSFLFAGDAEEKSERDILAAGSPVRAQILKAGHHGSSTATTPAFIDAVNPSFVVISCGKVNSYGHPHKEVLDMLAERNIPVFRTDEQGTVIMSTDGLRIYEQ